MTPIKNIIVVVVVVSAFAITGCSDVEMTADESPGSETPENYDVDIKEPTNGTVFDNLYVYGMIGHHFQVLLLLENRSSLEFEKIKEIQYEKINANKKTAINERSNRTAKYGGGIYLMVPHQDYVSERNYRLEALNETGHIVDAVNVTITQTGSDSGWF
ncbi:hypothetical protein [Halapricum hydrolyticum]|uniref:Uncharacterized protein n=1 Tax=Halapricum hydrolyticum TaxID=2979991 RepID=A0AAE3IDK8_9EURY|nr:hypothetical protein [Halapricum hydrolyticum]MCU4719442.1 hypothetical protein [Halapricum hydrolyticum]MCU4728451.1 hypothetical protein [Halapricum hydrolyticum]